MLPEVRIAELSKPPQRPATDKAVTPQPLLSVASSTRSTAGKATPGESAPFEASYEGGKDVR